MTDDKKTCPVAVTRHGKPFHCELPAGHAGDHEATEAGQVKPRVSYDAIVLRLVPVGYRRTDLSARAYVVGAVHYATGLGLDRLASDLGHARAKGESDHDLSGRLATLLGVKRA